MRTIQTRCDRAGRVVVALGLAAVVFAACGGTASRGGTVPTADTEELGNAVRQARGVVQEAYQTLRRGNVGGLQPLLSEDLFVVGPGPGQVYAGRAEALDALSQAFTGGRKHRLTSRRLTAVSSPSGKSAWVADQLKIDGTSMRLTAVLAEIDELWVIVALELSFPVTGKQAEKLPDSEQAAPAASMHGGVDAAAQDVARLFEEAIAAPGAWAEQWAERAQVVAIGSAPSEYKRGLKSIRRAWKKALKANPKTTLDGEMRASLTPDGALAWVAADVEASNDRVKPRPHHYFAIYERSPDGWRLVAMHAAMVTPGR